MAKIFVILLPIFFLQTSVHAADKIRITIPNLSGQFMTFPLAQKRGFLKEEGIDAEIIRVTGGANSAALSGGEVDYSTGMALGGAITGITRQGGGVFRASSCSRIGCATRGQISPRA